MAFFGIAIFLSLLLSFVAGLMAVGYALLRDLPTAKKLGWFAIGSDLFAVLMSLPLTTVSIFLFLPVIVPGFLGLTAVALCQRFAGQPPVQDRQMPLAMLFYLIAVIGLLMSMCICSGLLWDLDLDP